MAETDEYPSTPLLSLLLDFLAIVIKHSRLSESAAKQLILDYYAEVRPRRRYHYQTGFTLDVDDVDTNSPKPQKLRFAAIAPRHWRDHARVDWADSRASPDDPRYEMRLVRLYTGDAFAILRWAGLLPPAAQSASEPEPVAEFKSEPASAPVADKPSVWFRAVRRKREYRKRPDEAPNEWAERLIEKMKTDKAVGLVDRVWPQSTMERRLRDKGEDDDESFPLPPFKPT